MASCERASKKVAFRVLAFGKYIWNQLLTTDSLCESSQIFDSKRLIAIHVSRKELRGDNWSRLQLFIRLEFPSWRLRLVVKELAKSCPSGFAERKEHNTLLPMSSQIPGRPAGWQGCRSRRRVIRAKAPALPKTGLERGTRVPCAVGRATSQDYFFGESVPRISRC